MKSLYDFIVEPLGETYNNEVQVEDKKLIVNSKIESFKFVNRHAVVKACPLAYYTGINVGDIVIVHQNVFRVFYDTKGKQKKSRSWFKDNLYFCQPDQVYLYKQNDVWNTFNDRCFVKPIKNKSNLSSKKEQDLIGILKYGNSFLESKEIYPGDLIGYTPYGEWEFVIDEERLYCMKSNDIVIKYENQGNEEEYNPSWASSSR
tara:strand:- start:1125 stop:1733 length:609 start_codon:yes stop_codon:yes gene_type:complete